MSFVYVDGNGFVRASEDGRILGIKTGVTAEGHITYTSNGVMSGEGVDMSKISPVYLSPGDDARIPSESVTRVNEILNESLQKARAKAAEHPELEWTFEFVINGDGQPSIEARGKPRKDDTGGEG